MDGLEPKLKGWRLCLHTIVFESDTTAGKLFDLAVIISIILSVIAVMLDSISSFNTLYGELFFSIELFFTVLFTIEYALRLLCVGRPMKYATSFFGVVDLVSIVPTYLSFFLPGSQYLLAVRILRVLRVFRILKFANYINEGAIIIQALRASRKKITVFLVTVFTLVVILGSLMYVIEGGQNGFTSIPRSIYWAVVTLTTVGYGDIAPKTNLGQALAAFVMILGYGILAVPTGIVTVSMSRAADKVVNQACHECGREGHDHNAKYCKFCGANLYPEKAYL